MRWRCGRYRAPSTTAVTVKRESRTSRTWSWIFLSTHPWIDCKQFHAKINPLLDEKFKMLLKMHELELSESPGPVHDRGDGKDDLPREGQADLGGLDPPEAPDLRAQSLSCEPCRELQPPHAREDQD